MRFARCAAPFLTAASLLSTGCSESDPLNRQAVMGTVTLAGRPIQHGSIEFHPVGERGTMSGTTIADGDYSVDSSKGLAPGDYIVRIFASDDTALDEEVPGESRLVAKQLIPAEYNAKSNQLRTVVAGQENSFDFSIPAAAK